MGNRVNDFKDLIVWQKSLKLFENVISDLKRIPDNKVTNIISRQIIRSSGSVSANIAEGFGRKTKGEFKNHLGIARGSAYETEDWYIKIEKLKYITNEILMSRTNLIVEIKKMLNTLISRLN